MVPLELIISIIEWAYYDDTHSPDYPTLSACSLVCRSWNSLSRSLLFRSAAISKAVICQQLVELFNRDLQLGSSVRILCLSVGGDTIDPSMLPCILRAVPRLYELLLRSTGIIEFSAPVMDELRSLTTSPRPIVIRSLVLERMGVQSRILYQILDIWPTIQFLRLGSECASSPPANRPPFRLYELILIRIPSAENIQWLLAKNDNALRFLELRDDPSTALKSVLADQAKHIRSLRLQRYNIRSAPLVSQCSNIEELFLWNLPGTRNVLAPLHNLPGSVKIFGFWLYSSLHMLPSTILDRTIAVISGWQKLHTIICNPAFVEEYQEVFHSRNMKVTIRPALSYYLFEDPIVSEHLPRGRSVDNFKLMN